MDVTGSGVNAKELIRLISEGDSFIYRMKALNGGDKRMPLSLDEIRQWSLEVHRFASDNKVSIPPQQYHLDLRISWEGPTRTYVNRVLSALKDTARHLGVPLPATPQQQPYQEEIRPTVIGPAVEERQKTSLNQRITHFFLHTALGYFILIVIAAVIAVLVVVWCT